jgi:hypothetical protein
MRPGIDYRQCSSQHRRNEPPNIRAFLLPFSRCWHVVLLRGVGRRFRATLADVQINLSTTSVADDALSLTFADNVGADDTVVFSSPLPLQSRSRGSNPKNFDIVINLTTPFFYDPAMGNLLLDVRNFGGGKTTFFDSVHAGGDGVSRVDTNIRGNVNSPVTNSRRPTRS